MKMKDYHFLPFFLALILCLPFNSCKKNIVPTELTLSTDLVTASFEGGIYNVSFPAESFAPESINIKTDVEWVNSFEITEGQINFNVDKNTLYEQRETKVEVYTQSSKVHFTVRQDPAPAPKYFQFEIKEVTPTEIIADITPADESMYFCLMAIDKALYEKDLKGDDELLKDGIIKQYEEMARMYGVFLKDILEGQLRKGKQSDELFEDMIPETDYYIFAVGMTFEGEFVTPIEKVLVTTEPMEMKDLDFNVEISNITYESIDIKVTPSDLNAVYYLTFGEKSRLVNDDGSQMTDEQLTELLQNEIFNLIKLGMVFGQTKEEVLEEICYSGVSTGTIDGLYAGKDYYAFTVGIDKSGYFNSDMSKKEFKTESVLPSDNQFTMTITPSVNYAIVNLKVTNQDDPYYMACIPSDRYPGDDKLVEMLAEEKVESMTGNIDDAKIPMLTPGTEYTFFVLGYKAGNATTPIHKQNVKTLTNESAADIDITITLEDLNEEGVTVILNGNPAGAPYYFDIISEEYGLDEIKAQMEQLINDYIEYGAAADARDFYSKAASYGEDSYRYQPSAGKRFKIFAYGIDMEKGEMIENTLTFSETFEIPKKETSDGNISVEFDKCFDVDALAELYPEDFGEYKGMNSCVLPISIKTDPNIDKTYIALFTNDITNVDMYPDEIMIMNLERPDVGNTAKDVEFILTYNQLYSIIAVGVDENGKHTKVYRQTVKKTKGDVSPVEEYNSLNMRSLYRAPVVLNSDSKDFSILRKPSFESSATSVTLESIDCINENSSPFIHATNIKGKASGLFEKNIDRKYHIPVSR